MTNVETPNGAAFDKAYVDREVAYHEAVLGAVRNMMIPNVKSAGLTALLLKHRPPFVAQLKHRKTPHTLLK